MIQYEYRYDVKSMSPQERRTFNVWKCLKSRCTNPNSNAYARYGGRGIKVCDRWAKSFMHFIEDMGLPPTPYLEIDRINNDGNYEPGNCRWATRKQNLLNYSRNVWVEIEGLGKKTLCHWADYAGITRPTIHSRYKQGVRGVALLRKPNSRQVTIEGITKHLREWSMEAGLTEAGLARRIEMGITGKDILLPCQTGTWERKNKA